MRSSYHQYCKYLQLSYQWPHRAIATVMQSQKHPLPIHFHCTADFPLVPARQITTHTHTHTSSHHPKSSASAAQLWNPTALITAYQLWATLTQHLTHQPPTPIRAAPTSATGTQQPGPKIASARGRRPPLPSPAPPYALLPGCLTNWGQWGIWPKAGIPITTDIQSHTIKGPWN